MALPLQQIDFNTFGGGNWSDQPGALIRRSHRRVEGGFAQVAPVESPNLDNMDFVERAIGKRKGSTLLADYSAVLISGDAIIKEASFVTPGTTGTAGIEYQVGVGAKGIYTNISGSMVRATNANATNFQWPTDITKCSIIYIDGRALIMPDQGTIQVLRNDASLDDQLRNSTTATTVDASSSSGQKVLNVAITSPFRVGDRIVIDSAGTPEYGFVSVITGGASGTLTLEDNLGATYTVETVAVANRYTEAFGGATQTITGDWQDGTFMGFALHQRLCMGIGDSVWEYTDVGQVWDRAGGGFYQAQGNIAAAITFVPKGANELQTVGFLSTTAGPEFVPGFDLTDTPKPMQGGGTALNHQVIASIDNWIVYMTQEGGIEAVNYGQTIDLGRRFKTLDGVTGPMDTFSATNSAHSTLPFVFNNRDKKQLQWFYPDASQTTNSHAVVLDFYLGEPVFGEALESYEQRVRCLYWSLKDPATNPWFVSVYQKKGAVVGVLATGLTYTVESGKDDLDTIAIEAFWEEPNHDGGVQDNQKNYRRLGVTFEEKGDWNVNLRTFLNYAESQTGADVTMSQIASSTVWGASTWGGGTWAGDEVVRQTAWRELYGRAIRHRLYNNNAEEDFVIRHITDEYTIGSIQD